MKRPRPPLKTYSHLQGARRVPTEYELVTSRLLYYVERGFEVNVPLGDWYRQYQTGSPLACSDWEKFKDPRETTYTAYTALQSRREGFVDGILQSIEDSGYDQRLSVEALALLEETLPPLRYPVHALQMLAAYVGQMGPGGRITIAALLQTGDELRRTQRLAYRMAQLRIVRPGFGEGARELWQRGAHWQPLREVIERLLVTYDWGEAFTALNLCLKPAFDQVFMSELAERARSLGDFQLGQVLGSLDEDCRWHRQWTAALVRTAVEDRPANREVLQGWIDSWYPRVHSALVPLTERTGTPGCLARVDEFQAGFLGELSLRRPP